MPLLCICHSAPCAEALTALRDMEGKLQTCGIKQRPSETQHVVLCVREWVRACLCVCVCLKVSAKGRKTKITLCKFSFSGLESARQKLCTIFLQGTFTACTHCTADTACCNCMRVCLYSPWQAASSCWTWHLSRCYQVAEAITPLPGPPGHTVYLSRLGRHQCLGCWLEFALSLLHTVFNLCRCREYMQGCGPAFHSTLK